MRRLVGGVAAEQLLLEVLVITTVVRTKIRTECHHSLLDSWILVSIVSLMYLIIRLSCVAGKLLV
jgi:hypothetical protein